MNANVKNSAREPITAILFAVSILVIVLAVAPSVNAQTVVYSEGFETTDGSYIHTGTLDQWERGAPTSGPGSAHSGSECWATNLDGDVPKNSDSYLTSPAIAIPALGANEVARVRFFAWIAVDEMNDRGEFQVSSDGLTWETKAELLHVMQGQWTEYYFDVSDYAGGNIYIRFRLRADGYDAFISSSYNMAGLYIDDVAIMIYTAPPIETTVTLEAWEDQSAYASCPWVYTWDGSEYVKDNDVYSTARGPTKEFTDYYTLNKPLVPEDEQYSVQLRETEDEHSYTDLVQLITVDHASNVNIAADDNGNILTYSTPSQPLSAVDDEGNDVLSEIATEDDAGFNGYNDDYVVLDFSSLDVSNGATLVLRVQGFQVDGDPGAMTYARPWVHIQTQDINGDWVTRNEFYPRWDWSTSAYDLSGSMTTSQLVRLYVTSCHEGKYHVIDYAGLDTSPQAPTTTNTVSATSAVHAINGDVLSAISASDNDYAYMDAAETITLTFPVPGMAADDVRDFVFVAEGYYEPMGTYFIYTWDGSSWAQRDGWSIEGDGDQVRDFDLSLFLPDPNGEYKVRIWQDYWYEPAGIDYVGITSGSTSGTMVSAYDLRKSLDVTTELTASDDNKDTWPGYSMTRVRNRWVEVTWTGLAVNTPPTTNPVTVTGVSSPTPTISWTYNDADGDPQDQYEVEVWTGPGGTGTIMWDPAPGTGTSTSVVYAGSSLVDGETYYARVKAFDGTSWGGWSEASWVATLQPEPIPEFSTIALPVASILGLLFFFNNRKRREEN